MFPDVHTEEGLAAIHDGIVLIRGRFDHEFSVAEQKPGPAGAEALDARIVNLRFEVREAAECGADGFAQFAARFTASALLHNLPEHGMVHVAAAIVAHGGANRFRHFIDLRQQFFDGKFLKVGVALERFIEVGDVCAVVFVVMDFHGFCVNVGFQSVERIRQRWKCESHLRSGSLSCRSCGHNVPPDLQFLPHNYTRLPGKRGTGSWKYWMRKGSRGCHPSNTWKSISPRLPRCATLLLECRTG